MYIYEYNYPGILPQIFPDQSGHHEKETGFFIGVLLLCPVSAWCNCGCPRMHYAVNSGRARFCVLTPRLFAIIYPGSRLSQSCTQEQKLLWKRRFCISSTSATLNQCRTNISSTACVNFPAASSARLLSTVFRGGAFRKTSTWLFLQIFLACRLALDIQWEGVGGRVGIYFRVCVCLATMPRQTKAPAVIRLTSRAMAPEPATAFPLGCPSALRASQICANCHRSVKIHLCSR